jgi:molecular chaperone HtpG
MTVNANHPIYQQILEENDENKQQKLVRNLADLALLSQNLLTGADLTAFVNRSVELLGGEKKSKIILQ